MPEETMKFELEVSEMEEVVNALAETRVVKAHNILMTKVRSFQQLQMQAQAAAQQVQERIANGQAEVVSPDEKEAEKAK